MKTIELTDEEANIIQGSNPQSLLVWEKKYMIEINFPWKCRTASEELTLSKSILEKL